MAKGFGKGFLTGVLSTVAQRGSLHCSQNNH